ncbi:hypothetical protein EJ06DRAFT_522457 [Trichodelitschia bisporula]|uniref:DUF6536 domain-containing protein n=1 Tax=Trichodelitschia bisporula TaxID=703511 RepID=A0A6G1HUJ6_9PEZI|nr:hypothetical protein EJ06DRAFT_522457 [Trichodelitschia bisporula]
MAIDDDFCDSKKGARVTTSELSDISSFSQRRPTSDYERPPAPPFFKSPKAWFKHEKLSWRFYVSIYSGLAAVCLLINVIAIVVIVAVHGTDKNGRSTIYEGSCEKVKWQSRIAHVFISGLGTYMLSASAYVMYCLSPPTRREIDKAHAAGHWLDIGVMSMKNLFAINRKRLVLFLLLGISSPILQLFYNAVLFQTNSTNAYTAFVAGESFMQQNITVNFSHEVHEAKHLLQTYGNLAYRLHQEALDGRLEKLSNKDCLNEYAVPLQSKRRNVVVITEANHTHTTDVFDVYHAWIPTEHPQSREEQYSWICEDIKSNADRCVFHMEKLRSNASAWTISDGARVKYCLSEKTEEHCKLQFHITLAVIVTLVTLFKTAVMFTVAISGHESPLMTTGDAISSFLRNPDRHTAGMCMASKRMIEQYSSHWPSEPFYFYWQRKRWGYGIRTRTMSCALLMVLWLCIDGALYCTMSEPLSFVNLIRLGLGAINRNFFIGWHNKETNGMIRSIIIANLGHAIFGCLYILFNNVFYCMIFADEWARFAIHRKGLRVSEAPRGDQRTVYFFMMPHKMAIPIMAFSCAIHSLISQTLFFVDVEAYGHDPSRGEDMAVYVRQPQFDFSTTGFSPLADLGLIATGIFMIAFMFGMSARKLRSGMPVASTCSAAIAAACQPAADEDPEVHLKPVKWGVTEIVDGVGHCTFSAKEVKEFDESIPYM